jgi:hypothetical protein
MHYIHDNKDLPRRVLLQTNKPRFVVLDGHHLPELVVFGALGWILDWWVRLTNLVPSWIGIPVLILYPVVVYFKSGDYYEQHKIPREPLSIFVFTFAALDLAFLVGFLI